MMGTSTARWGQQVLLLRNSAPYGTSEGDHCVSQGGGMLYPHRASSPDVGWQLNANVMGGSNYQTVNCTRKTLCGHRLF